MGRHTGANCVGYGVGGTCLGIIPHDPLADRIFSIRAAEMEEEADIVAVFGGTNDYGNGPVPLGTMADRTPDTFYGACHHLCQLLINKYPHSVILFMTPLHRLGEERQAEGFGPDNTVTLGEYVAILKEVTAYYALPVLDLYTVSGMQPAIPLIRETYMPDGLHPNDAGHELIADRLKSFLRIL